jgi:hypothetical protein
MRESTLCVGDRQEPFAFAFISAIAAASGYGFTDKTSGFSPDRCSIDVVISSYNNKAQYQDLKIQSKCTYHHKIKDGYMSYVINEKNFYDIRDNKSPHLLVVTHIPSNNPMEWVRYNEKNIELRYNCYYFSLIGVSNIKEGNKSTTLKIPEKNILNQSSLSMLMKLIEEGKFITFDDKVVDI